MIKICDIWIWYNESQFDSYRGYSGFFLAICYYHPSSIDFNETQRPNQGYKSLRITGSQHCRWHIFKYIKICQSFYFEHFIYNNCGLMTPYGKEDIGKH